MSRQTLEHETTQRLVGALVGGYGYPLDDDTEKMAAALATVALAGVPYDADRLATLLRVAVEEWGEGRLAYATHSWINESRAAVEGREP